MFTPSGNPENIEAGKNFFDERAKLLEKYGAEVKQDELSGNEDAYIATFRFGEAITTIRVLFKDESGADLVITNMTTLSADKTKPWDSEMGKGFGSRAVQSILSWAAENNLKNIRAVQVQNNNENFWTKNGFAECEKPNPTNDFIYNEPEKHK